MAPAVYSVTDLGAPSGYNDFQASALNGLGQVVGTAYGNTTSIFLYSKSQWINLGEPSEYNNISPDAVNNSGQVLATATTGSEASPKYHALLYSKGQWNDLALPSGYIIFSAIGLDSSGQVLANLYTVKGGFEYPFLYSGGQWTELDAPIGVSYINLEVDAFNDSGQILAQDSVNPPGVFLYSNGQWIDVGDPSGISYINHPKLSDSGQVSGTAQIGNSGDDIPYLYSNGQWINLGLPSGYTNAPVVGIDSAGEVLANVYRGVNQPFLYSSDQWTNLNSFLPQGSTVKLTYANAINADGQIIADYGYLLTPQPATITTLGVSSSNVQVEESVTLSATVSSMTSNAGTPSGSVTFHDGSMALGTVTLTGGMASLTTTMPSGNNIITATYNGGTVGVFIFQPSRSAAQSVTVSMPPPVESLSLFAFGFGPGLQLDVFEVDQSGQVFALPFLSLFGRASSPDYLAGDVVLEDIILANDDVVGALVGGQGQLYLAALLDFNNPYVFQALWQAMVKQMI